MSCIQNISHTDLYARYPSHRHENVHQLIYVKRGNVLLKLAEEEIEVSAPSVIFISNLETHALISRNFAYERYMVNLDPHLTPSALQDSRLLSVFTDRPDSFSHVLPVGAISDRLDVLFSLLHEEFEKGTEESAGENGFGGICDSLIKTVLVVLYRFAPEAFPGPEATATDLIGQIKEELGANLGEALRMSDLARKHHLSPCYLSHLFKESTGYSMKRYRMLCRLAEARALLTDSTLSVTEVCGRVGFEDMSNFSRYFKAETGLTPTAYRTAGKNEA